MDSRLDDRSPYLSIGALSRKTGFSIDAIRYYERLGLLPRVGRTVGGHRTYGKVHVRRLHFIRRGRHLGLHLKQIREMLDRQSNCCEDVRALLGERAADVRKRLAELRAIERELQQLLNACGDAELAGCRIIEALHADGESRPSAYGCCARK